ncbi:YggS family pyridoxal phosphate-dependent enzyme [Paenibacillus thermotolerans]|uniref:YggS family pyridoxal phosphate-dependent enzyme n=1 Tax=Paenibacillus thermotolerans TaxID=3027807 RepID=UPI0023685941|nr:MULTISPECIES: YggS family pyridoxal phosphate-dependent enzyme [unclassified Paenibacillus]
MSEALQARIAEVRRRVEDACRRSGRAPDSVNIIAVTKYVSLERTKEAVDSGLIHVGENRWQDAKDKWEAIGAQGQGVWHFIGHLQTNKVKDVVGKFQYFHSLDRLSLAAELQKKAARLDLIVPCFVQVNVSGEDTKYGLPPAELQSFLRELNQLPNIEVIGLMTMAPHEEDPELTRPVFRELRRLRDAANAASVYRRAVPHLSMGMSNDFEIAIEEGATWIRLGSVLVGKDE